ncbi:hypothetical protein CXP39_02190 [Mesoplasma syrphidae]|uniref:Uncharacterized protein n=1 Tax=Mesoplasma syrphidae TaxID=225999 RepID=A0A2K9BK19_9MOLU|nr:hypothetical protein [Mesoplasma syrphidae]AUF83601.1 hypothetical protein CXP39_02190 [Mesoplasma syrphidae]
MLASKTLILLPTLTILSIIIFLLMIYLIVDVIKKLNKLKKFKSQKVAVYENKRILFFINAWIYLVMPILFVLAIVTFGLYFVVKSDMTSIVYGIGITLFLGYVIAAFIFLVWGLKLAESALVIAKNHKLAFLNDVISYESIIGVTNDLKRRKIFINYMDENSNLVMQMKLRYHWELKDFLKTLEIKTAFE